MTGIPESFFRVVVECAHVGHGGRYAETRFVRTTMSPGEIFVNEGKVIAGIKRVIRLDPITFVEFVTARSAGENCFSARGDFTRG